MAKETKRVMSDDEKKQWDDLYQYVRHNIMGYDKNQSLSRIMALRLKGLLNNKFIESNNVESTANYSYTTVLNTFKYSMPKIQTGLRNNNFRDEMHKFNYILKIVEGNLNTVYMRMKSAEKSIEKTERVIIELANINSNDGADYQVKSRKAPEELKDLW